MRAKKRKDRHAEHYGLTDVHKVRCPLCGEIINIAYQDVCQFEGRIYHTKCLFDNYQRITRRNKEDEK